jgi:hypothetical protein
MKNYIVSLLVDSQKKVHYIVRSTSKDRAKEKSNRVQHCHAFVKAEKTLSIKILK